MSDEAYPKAVAQASSGRRLRSFAWLYSLIALLAIGAAAVAAVISFRTLQPAGVPITITFDSGEGLEEGAPLRHRGIVVGEVTGIHLAEDLSTIRVEALIAPHAARIASAGTRFWIVKPQANIRGITGLETLLSGQYIAVDPSRRQDKPQRDFTGLAAAPITDLPGQSLEVQLQAADLAGLQSGAPVLFRGVKVGQIDDVRLAPDGRSVRLTATIDPNYRELIRENTEFWNISGLDVQLGFSGLAVQSQSLSTIALGGVQLATPSPAGPPASIGQRFVLQPSPPEQWKEWNAPLPIGVAGEIGLRELPQLRPAQLQWETSFLGFGRQQYRGGWLLATSPTTLVGPVDLMRSPEDAVKGTTVLTVGGHAIGDYRVVSAKEPGSTLATLQMTAGKNLPPEYQPWPAERIERLDYRTLKEPFLLFAEGDGQVFPVERQTLKFAQNAIALRNTSDLPTPLHGAVAIHPETRKVIGMVAFDDKAESYSVYPLPPLP